MSINGLTGLPDWLDKAVIGAALAALGYAGKAFLDFLKTKRLARRGVAAELDSLSALLEEGHSIFRDQNYKARRLMNLLRARLPNRVPAGLGFDETFFRLYPDLSEEERELHSLIRSATIISMKRVNLELSHWLDRNTEIRRRQHADKDRLALAEQLSLLQLHLNQWHDKFAAVMNDEKRSLVYLADEKQHGQGFPKDLEPVLATVLQSTRR